MRTIFLIPIGVLTAFLIAGCGDSNNAPQPTSSANNNNASPVTQPEVYAQRKVDVSSLNQAIQQYNTAQGHYPKDLKELAPNYIPRVPEAPAGYKYDYDPNSGTVKLVQQ